jgi:multimeric flavodoxin WrbA
LTSSAVEVLRWRSSAFKEARKFRMPAAAAMPSTLALFSSSRRLGNTGQLMDRIALELNIEVVDLAGQRISAYDYQHRNRHDDFEPLMQRVLSHDQIIFASPIYWYAVSPAMKAFLDRLSDFLDVPELLVEGRRLRGKTAYVVCTSVDEQPSEAFVNAFVETFRYLGMHYGGMVHINCEEGYLAGKHDAMALTFATLVRRRPAVTAARPR